MNRVETTLKHVKDQPSGFALYTMLELYPTVAFGSKMFMMQSCHVNCLYLSPCTPSPADNEDLERVTIKLSMINNIMLLHGLRQVIFHLSFETIGRMAEIRSHCTIGIIIQTVFRTWSLLTRWISLCCDDTYQAVLRCTEATAPDAIEKLVVCINHHYQEALPPA